MIEPSEERSPTIRVLDLFAGKPPHGWSAAFRNRGHEVITLDIEERFHPDILADILTWDPKTLLWKPTVVLASPPCTAFTVMRIGTNWTTYHTPKTDAARKGLEILERTMAVIREIDPQYWWLENPVGKMRRMKVLEPERRATVTYCQYSTMMRSMKPTDLWGRWPDTWEPRPRCSPGDPCHISPPRGSRTATQGDRPSEDVAEVEYGLSRAVCMAVERALSGERGPQRTIGELVA